MFLAMDPLHANGLTYMELTKKGNGLTIINPTAYFNVVYFVSNYFKLVYKHCMQECTFPGLMRPALMHGFNLYSLHIQNIK